MGWTACPKFGFPSRKETVRDGPSAQGESRAYSGMAFDRSAITRHPGAGRPTPSGRLQLPGDRGRRSAMQPQASTFAEDAAGRHGRRARSTPSFGFVARAERHWRGLSKNEGST